MPQNITDIYIIYEDIFVYLWEKLTK
jgi:hypothetical protein